MKNKIIVNSFRNIRKALPRFISLLIMSMLGVFVFAGLQATSPDMIKTLDKYLDQSDTYDVKLVSTLGFYDKQVEQLKSVKGVNNVEPVYSIDAKVTSHKENIIFNITSLTSSLNKVTLLSGKLPENNNEIVVEENYLKLNDLSLNSIISFSSDNLVNQDFTICGTVDSSLYFNNVDAKQYRGSTSLGSGSIDYYAYVNKDVFKMDYYSSIYLTVDGAKKEITSSKKYLSLLDDAKAEIGLVKESIEDEIYQDIVTPLNEKIDQEEKKANEQFSLAEKEFANRKGQIDSLEAYYQELLKTNNLNEDEIDSNITSLNETIKNLDSALQNTEEGSAQYQELMSQKKAAEEKLVSLEKLSDLRKQVITAQSEYNTQFDAYSKTKEESLKSIESAKEEVAKIKKGKIFIYDRSDYTTYSEYIDDSNSIANLSKIFPFVFYLVAVLVSLISMNRMVEDDRTEIGTLKSLGFSNKHIVIKYFMFSFLATIIGGLLGSGLGLVIIPTMIFNIYKILFEVPSFQIGLNLGPTIIGLVLSIICVCGTSILTSMVVLKEKPSQLMRPKAPKKGKRVIFEKTKLWNKISFSNKVTIRNIFRYKKRVLVTIFGIAGCCALMLCGFGIKDSISNIPEYQYGRVFRFDGMVYVNDLSEDEIDNIFKRKEIKSITQIDSIKASVNSISVNLFVCENNEELKNVVSLNDVNTKKQLTLNDNEVIINDKLASLNKVGPGDLINIVDINNISYQYVISGVCENYIDHYVFINRNTFEKTNQTFTTNVVFFNIDESITFIRDDLISDLLNNEGVLSVSFVDTLISKVDDMLGSLNKVVLILIVLAMFLSFVVLYNLSNININERKREIATLKVLGFYNKEVDNYITKENIILTLIGIAIGLLAGYLLTNIVVMTIEIERARFIKNIFFTSYLFASLISMLFTLIVNLVTHFTLKKIDMIESLKSIE